MKMNKINKEKEWKRKQNANENTNNNKQINEWTIQM